jgi:hypothetical protein
MLGIDLAGTPEAVEPADIVVLHRVVCCYPDITRLLGAAAGRSRRAVVFSYPVRTLLMRLSVRAVNAWSALNRSPYRMFAHTADDMLAVLSARGFETRYRASSGPWRIVGATRP